MEITFRFFAAMAQHAGVDRLTLLLPPNAPLSLALEAVRQTLPALPWPTGVMIAVNQEYAALDRVLTNGDEVAIIPPVSGGCG